MKTVWFPSKKTFLVSLILFVLVTGYVTYDAFLTAWLESPGSSGDQTNIGIMELRLSDDSLYSRDYLFKDTTLFRFYTPVFISLTTALRHWTGSYFLGLAILVPISLLFYQVGMYLLTYQVTGNNLIAMLIALISSRRWWSIGVTYWGVAGINAMVPRSLFLMCVPWIILAWFTWLHDKSYWKLSLIAFFIGLLSNLHPVSGYLLTQLLLSIFVLELGFSRKAILKLIGLFIAIVMGAWPTLINFLRNTNSNVVESVASVPFVQFYTIIKERLDTMFPLKPDELVLWNHSITANEQIIIVWLYLLLMVLVAVSYLLSRRGVLASGQPKLFFGLMFVIQLPLAFLLTRFSTPALFILLGLYPILIKQPDKWDRWLLMFMTFTICYSFIAAYFLEIIWRQLEWLRLTVLVAEQMRIARFVYLPLFLYVARILTLLASNVWPNWVRTSLLTLIVFFLMWSNFLAILVMVFVSGIILIQLNYEDTWQHFWAKVLNLLTWHHRLRWHQVAISMSLMTLIIIGFIQFTSSVTWQTLPSNLQQQIAPTLNPEQEDTQALFAWARSETDIDSLFYYDSLEFRHRAQRSLTHSWKDLGIAYYSQSLLIPFHERYQKLQAGYEDVTLLLSYATEYDVNYIIIESKYNLILDLPVAFKNNSYTVYEFSTD